MTTISPSLLSCDFMNIADEVLAFKGIPDIWLHIDVMYGHFVPNLTFGPPIIKKLSKITDLKLDAHFMVTNPEFYIPLLKDHGVHNYTFHLEANPHPEKLLIAAKKLFPSVGVSIRPSTPVSALTLEVLGLCDLILVMSVEPGFGGQKFIEASYEKIRDLVSLRMQHKFTYLIQVDGGINDKNAGQLISAGADNLVAGSYVFCGDPKNYAAQIESLRS